MADFVDITLVVVVIKDSISLFPERCADTVYTYGVEFLLQWWPSGIYDSLSTGYIHIQVYI